MGMAASQARYLGLTARKTNTEYEGQQVNQARTALANQSANLFNQLLALEVPVAPKTTDYTELQYSYSDGPYAECIDSMYELSPQDDGYNYLVTHHHYADVYTGIREVETNPEVKAEEGPTRENINMLSWAFTADRTTGDLTNVKVKGQDLTQYVYGSNNKVLDDIIDTMQKQYDTATDTDWADAKADQLSGGFWFNKDANGVYQVYLDSDIDDSIDRTVNPMDPSTWVVGDSIGDYHMIYEPKLVGNCELTKYTAGVDSTIDAALKQIKSDWPEMANYKGDIYWYEDLNQVYFSTKDDLIHSSATYNDPRYHTENQERLPSYMAQALETRIEETERARIQINGEGRWENISYENSSANYVLNTETQTDTAAYEDAMNKYTHDIATYEKTIADINAQTEIIQQEDRTLELRLKQLDTEQKALQTEMEAVAKVIQKNVEMTFKTFSS